MSQPTVVFRVLRNADTTEGRGPMVYVATFATFEAANTYIMAKGPPYKSTKFKAMQHPFDKTVWDYEGWYSIHQDEVIQEYSPEQVKKDIEELNELEKRAEILRKRTKL